MRIDPEVVISPVTRDAREAPATAIQSGEEASGGSVVELSAARLQTIRAMLDRGDYPVDLDLLASRIVDGDVLRAGAVATADPRWLEHLHEPGLP